MTDENRSVNKTIGYLKKRGKMKFMNSWKKYWFVLEGHLLLYYGSKDDYDALSPCKGSITLGPTCIVQPYSSAPLGFQITTRSTTITLRAENIIEQTKWMQAIVSTLKQNSGKNPTKLNHFRYSMERVDMLMHNGEPKKETPASPVSPKLKNSPLRKLERNESALLDRLQKLGARSYSDGATIQNAENVRNQNVRKFSFKVKDDSIGEDKKKAPITSPKKLQFSPKNSVSHIYEEIPEKNDVIKKEEEIVLEDEDYCVCTLGKDKDERNLEDSYQKRHTKDLHDIKRISQHVYSEPNNNWSMERKTNLFTRKSSADISDKIVCGMPQSSEPSQTENTKSRGKISRQISLVGEYYTCDNELPSQPKIGSPKEKENVFYAEVNKRLSGKSEKLEKTLKKESNNQFECDNEIYNAPSAILHRENGKSLKNQVRQFQFPPAPKEEFVDDRTPMQPNEVVKMINTNEQFKRIEKQHSVTDKQDITCDNELYTTAEKVLNTKETENQFENVPTIPKGELCRRTSRKSSVRDEESCENSLYTTVNHEFKTGQETQFQNEPKSKSKSEIHRNPERTRSASNDEAFECENDLYTTVNTEFKTEVMETQFKNAPNGKNKSDLYKKPERKSSVRDKDYLKCKNDLYTTVNKEIKTEEIETEPKVKNKSELYRKTERKSSFKDKDYLECDNDLYTTVNKEFKSESVEDEDFDCENELYTTAGKGPKDLTSDLVLKKKDLQYEEELYSEPGEFHSKNDLYVECDNEIYAEPQINQDIYSEPDEECSHISADDNQSQNENEIYAEPNIGSNSEIYAEPNINYQKLYSEPNNEECSSNIEENEKHLYHQPYGENLNEDTNVYEDPETLLLKKNDTVEEKSSKKKIKRKSDSSTKSLKTLDSKKNDGFIQRLLKQAAWKHSDKSERSEEMAPMGVTDVDKTLVMLTDIQELLEKKKALIAVLAQQEARKSQSRNRRMHSPPIHDDMESGYSSRSEPQKSPDLLQDLNDSPTYTSSFSMNLNEEYSTVHDGISDVREEIYSEVVSERHSKELKDLLEELLKCNKDGTHEASGFGSTLSFHVAVDSKGRTRETI